MPHSLWDREASGIRFSNPGLKTNAVADALQPNKFPYIQNIRSYRDTEIQSRPQKQRVINSPLGVTAPVIALEANLGIYKIGSHVYKNASAIDFGYSANPCSIMPYRPNQSPQSWDYIWDSAQSRKTNGTLTQNTGIVEPQASCDAGISSMLLSPIGRPGGNASSFTNAGTAGSVTNGNAVTDPVGAVFFDSANPALQTIFLGTPPSPGGGVVSATVTAPGRYVAAGTTFTTMITGGGGSGCTVMLQFGLDQMGPPTTIKLVGIIITNPGSGYTSNPTLTITCSPPGNQVNPAFGTLSIASSPVSLSPYTRFMLVTPSSTGTPTMVNDVFSPIPGPLNIASIFYYSGSTGRCVLVCQNLGTETKELDDSIYGQILLNNLQRGALIQIGSELCLVLSVTLGPDGSVAIETTTTGTHTTSEQVTGVPSLRIVGVAQVGDTITSGDYNVSVTAGIGTVTALFSSSPFVNGGVSFQQDDYIHIRLLADHLANINEIKLLFDCGNGSFTQNFYFYTIRPSDIEAGVQNTLTQLGVAQIITQRATIDEENAAASNNQAQTSSSSQTVPGDLQWSDIVFPISALTRVGNDQTKNLQTVNSVQILINANATVGFDWGSISVFGGYQQDVGATGMPTRYRIRPRSSITGAKGNPSPEMRYAVSSRRQQVIVLLPQTYPDTQMDTWDVFRMGGALEDYVYVGSAPLGSGNYLDNFSDASIETDNVLETNLYQPFPTIDLPFIATATLQGTAITATVTSGQTGATILRYLPGTILNVGQNVYTLRFRPTLISGSTYYMEVVENAGAKTGVTLNIFEPDVGAQPLAAVWGPDANGRFFGVGDSLRPGVVYTTNPNDPDSSGDNPSDLCPPTEPLQNGGLVGGTSMVASTKRWWRGFPQENGSYDWKEVVVGAALEFQWAICSDGKSIYYVGWDGIYITSGGAGESLTDADLYNLFPHEDFYPAIISYNGKSIVPPNYGQGLSFRLQVVNSYLFFDYIGIDSNYHTLACNLRTKSWVIDQDLDQISVRACITTPPLPTSGTTPLQQMFCGSILGAIYQEVSSPTPGSGETVNAIVATNEMMFGDIRAPKLIGDIFLDCLPSGTSFSAVPMFLGAAYSTPTSISTSATRTGVVVDIGGEQLERSVGLFITWNDQGTTSFLYSWQPSYIPKPEVEQGRFGDWDEAGYLGNKFFQGFLLTADTQNVTKNLSIRDSDTQNLHTFTGPTLVANQILHNGQTEIAYSFNTPFRAHLVRYEPGDEKPWQFYNLKWVFQPTPEFALTWQIQPTAFGFNGYMHPQRILLAYNSTATVNFAVTVDGRAYSFTLPSTAGIYAKTEVIFNALMKGLVYTFAATSAAVFAIWPEDSEVLVKQWGSNQPYSRQKLLGGAMGNVAQV